MGDTVKHRAAVVAEGWRQVREHLPFVLLARLRTRNSARESPVLHLWSDPVWRRDRNETVTIGISIWHPKRRNPVIGKKTSSPSFVTFPFPFFSIFIPRFFPRSWSEAEATRSTMCTWTCPCDNDIMNVKDKKAQDYDVRRWWSVPHRCNWNSFLLKSYIHYIYVSRYDVLFAWCVQFLAKIWSNRFLSY